MSKDYYKTLGVEKNASQDEVKKAFRKLAHQWHPDKTGGDEAKFKEINEAYQVLSDADKRRRYDQFGSAAFDGPAGGPGAGFGGFDFSGMGFEDLGDIFGDAFGFGGGGRRRRKTRGADVQMDVDLSFEEAVFGADKDVTLTTHAVCERCAGSGGEPGSGVKSCETCGGSGVRVTVQRTMLGNIQSRSACPTCGGAGKIVEKPCSSCGGAGVERKRRTITVHIPEGVDDGNVMRLRGEGEAAKGGESGDLYLRLHVAPDRRFAREGSLIRSEARVNFTQAALGAEIDVETLDGTVSLKVPPGTQSGTEFRLRGKGVPEGGRRGDHFVTVRVVTPQKLSKKQQQMFREIGLDE